MAVIKYWEYLPNSHRPSCERLVAVVMGFSVGLITAKLSHYSFITSLLQPFLKKHQTDKQWFLSMQRKWDFI